MNAQLKQLCSLMEQGNVDWIVVTSPQNIFYVTNYHSDPHERFMALVVSRHGDTSLIVPTLDFELARQVSINTAVIACDDYQDPYELLGNMLPASIQQIGLEKRDLSLLRFELLHARICADRYVDINDWFSQLRSVKSPDEIVRVKKAIEVVEQVLSEGIKRVKSGVSEVEIAAELDYLMRKKGVTGPTFTIVLSGENSALPHGKPTMKPIRPGEFLLIDLGLSYDGYWADLTRTFVIDDCNEEKEHIYQTVLAANQASILATRPGAICASIDAAARDLISASGYGRYFVHRIGHGLGIEIHESPSLHGQNTNTLSVGNVCTIEPGIYLPGVGGVRIEDDVLVTETGREPLTSYPKELIRI